MLTIYSEYYFLFKPDLQGLSVFSLSVGLLGVFDGAPGATLVPLEPVSKSRVWATWVG